VKSGRERRYVKAREGKGGKCGRGK